MPGIGSNRNRARLNWYSRPLRHTVGACPYRSIWSDGAMFATMPQNVQISFTFVTPLTPYQRHIRRYGLLVRQYGHAVNRPEHECCQAPETMLPSTDTGKHEPTVRLSPTALVGHRYPGQIHEAQGGSVHKVSMVPVPTHIRRVHQLTTYEGVHVIVCAPPGTYARC